MTLDSETTVMHFGDADTAIGMHVPTSVPDERESRRKELQGVDLFTKPGETRTLPVSAHSH